MEYEQKLVRWLFVATVIGVLVAVSQYIFPWPSFLMHSNNGPIPSKQKSVPQPKVSNIPSLKPVPDVFYTKEQIAEHNTVDNCWLSLTGQVYDLSSLLHAYKQIPNVSQICGTDLTGVVNPLLKQYGMQDSSQLTSVLSQYAVGKLK